MKYKITATSIIAALIFVLIYNLPKLKNVNSKTIGTDPHNIAVFYTPNNVDTITLYTEKPLRTFSSEGTNYVKDYDNNSIYKTIYSSTAPIKILK